MVGQPKVIHIFNVALPHVIPKILRTPNDPRGGSLNRLKHDNVTLQIIDKRLRILCYLALFLTFLVPIVYLERNQNADHYQENLTESVTEEFHRLFVRGGFLTGTAKNPKHGRSIKTAENQIQPLPTPLRATCQQYQTNCVSVGFGS
jgi:hypothetical protein